MKVQIRPRGPSSVRLKFVPGIRGFGGWSPIFSVVTDGSRRVLQISDWTGGEGPEPASGSYVGAAGLVPDIASAVDIRGAQGPANTLSIGTVTTGAAGSSASAEITGASPSQTLNLTIPRGDKGLKGDKGDTGDPSAPGSISNLQVAANAGIAPSKIAFQQSGAGAVVRTAEAKMKESVSVLDFIPVNLHAGIANGSGTTDLSVYLQAARDYIASHTLGTGRPALKFPAGVYVYSVSPNWAITNAHIFAEGDVRLRYTGTDTAVILDAGGDYVLSNQMQMRMGRFIVEATAGTGVLVRAVHHSELEFDVRGCGPDSPALDVYACVCTVFRRFTASKWAGLTGEWYMNAQPGIGVRLDRRYGNELDTEPVSFCVFDTPIIEHTKTGALLNYALGCIFENGTIEGCTVQGVQIVSPSLRNIFRHVDFESNANHDISCGGHDNWIINCDTMTLVALNNTALRCWVVGGQHHSINVFSGAQNCFVQDLMYASEGGTLVNDSVSTTFKSLVNATTGKVHDAPHKRTPLDIGTGPNYTYMNTRANHVQVLVAGGTVSQIDYIHAGVGDPTGMTRGLFNLPPGSGLVIYFTVTPNVVLYEG